MTIKMKYSPLSLLRKAALRSKVELSRSLRFFGFKAPNHSIVTEVAFTERYFDTQYYLEMNVDVVNSKTNPFLHYISHGYFEGRSARFFDNGWYVRQHSDVEKMGFDGFEHYIQYGKEEGRRARYVVVSPEDPIGERNNYGKWLKAHKEILQRTPDATSFKLKPKISIIMAVYNPSLQHLDAAIQSVLAQGYGNWELCIADDASTNDEVISLLHHYSVLDSRIKVLVRGTNGHISEASNSALFMTNGDYIALLDHDDLLVPTALEWIVDTINRYPDADIIYSDEDKIGDTGTRFDPYFKSDFNYELFLAQNMISHLGVYRAVLVKGVGGFRKGVEGAQDHDLALRVLENSNPSKVIHIPRVLYHWRATEGSTALAIDQKSYAPCAGKQVIQDHLDRLGTAAQVTFADGNPSHYRVRFELMMPLPLISIIIPTRDRIDILKVCIESIRRLTTYQNFEIIIIDNGSELEETKDYLHELKMHGVNVIRDDRPFNYSALNNLGVEHATGSMLCLLNNDIEILTEDWLEELLSFAQRPNTGCVGARLWYPDRILQHGGVVLGIGGVAGHAHKGLSNNSTGYFSRAIHHQSYSAVTAACLMIKRSIYLEVGGFDENLPVAFNDVDFCLKVNAAGYTNIWTPYAEMIHHESASRGSEKTAEQQLRFTSEVELMRSRWSKTLLNDPAYNANLTLEHEDYSLAWPPRL
jgi:glycosyltransferase involved in cell wall biosynthesis